MRIPIALVIVSLLTALSFVVGTAPDSWACDHVSGQAVSSGSSDGVFWVNGTSESSSECPAATVNETGSQLVVGEAACGLGGSSVCHESTVCTGGGILYETSLVFPDGDREPGPLICVGGETDATTPAITGAMVAEAFRKVRLPRPTLSSNPPDGETLVNLPTIYYTRAEAFTRDLRLLGRRVHLRIAPVAYRWSLGQGGNFETEWPGRPYADGVDPEAHPDHYVTWTYTDAGPTETTRVTVVWGANWTLDGGPARPVPGTVPMTSPATSMTIREATGVLSGAR